MCTICAPGGDIEEAKCRNSSYPLERIMKEIRRRTRVVESFPNGRSALMLVAARLRHIAGTKWGLRRYLNMDRLKELDKEESAALAG
jgi:transposase-like protein